MATRAAEIALTEHMCEISGDTSGSEPSEYLRADEVSQLYEALDELYSRDWEGAQEISMRKCWVPGVPAWTSPLHVTKSGLTLGLFYPVVSEKQKGVPFGYLAIAAEQMVAIADDGLLYSRRGRELRRSNGIGWGRLPDPELLAGGLAVGRNAMIHYGDGDLGETILNQHENKAHAPRMWPF